jgi:hypothetical protein
VTAGAPEGIKISCVTNGLQPVNRRNLLWLGGSEVISGMTVGGYANQIEPHHLVVERRTIRLPHLSSALDGFHIALMSDHHLFPGKTNFTLID